MAKKITIPDYNPIPFLRKEGIKESPRIYQKKELIFLQGDAADSVFYILKGKAKVSVVSDQGREVVVAIVEQDNFLGEGGLTGHAMHLGSASALERSVILRIDKTTMLNLVNKYPKYADDFIVYLLERISKFEEALIDQLVNNSERRLARLLLILAHYGKDAKAEPIEIDVSQETLAMMIGTTRSRVSKFMNKFRKLGLIDYNGKTYVKPGLLRALLRN